MNKSMTENEISEKLKIFLTRSSVRNFTQEKISDAVLNQLFCAALQAPTSSHIQAFSIINITDAETRTKFYHLCGQQPWILEASHFVILCADLYKVATWSQLDFQELPSEQTPNGISQDAYLASLIDAALVGMTLSLAAETLHIGSVMIGSIRNSVSEVAQILQLPIGVVPVFGLCLGYFHKRKQPKPRLPKNLLIFENQYALPENHTELRDKYSSLLAQYYNDNSKEYQGFRNVPWLQVTTHAVQDKKRARMGTDLMKQGFHFEKK